MAVAARAAESTTASPPATTATATHPSTSQYLATAEGEGQDGDQDLLVAGDFLTSRVYENNGAGFYNDITTPVISDENGMGLSAGSIYVFEKQAGQWEFVEKLLAWRDSVN